MKFPLNQKGKEPNFNKLARKWHPNPQTRPLDRIIKLRKRILRQLMNNKQVESSPTSMKVRFLDNETLWSNAESGSQTYFNFTIVMQRVGAISPTSVTKCSVLGPFFDSKQYTRTVSSQLAP